MKKDNYDCSTCEHRFSCEKEYGEEREDGDDFRAVIGTHFCRASWDIFIGYMKEIHNGNIK